MCNHPGEKHKGSISDEDEKSKDRRLVRTELDEQVFMKMSPSLLFWEKERMMLVIIENTHQIKYPELIRSQR